MIPTQRSIISLFLVLTFTVVSFASQIFLSTTGNDTTGMIDRIDLPFRTIPKAILAALPGDTIFVRGGHYTLGTKITISENGSEDGKYYLFAYQQEHPVLDFSSMTVDGSNRGIELSGNFWYIKGLGICKAGDNGMSIRGSNNIIEQCNFFENKDSGLQLSKGASYNQIINCDSYYNEDPGQENADGFAPKLDVGTGNYFYGCRAWQNSDDGFDGYLRSSDDITTTFENCWTFKNGYLKDGSAGAGNGNGFKIGGGDNNNIDSLKHNVILKTCLAFDNLAKGFDQNNNRGSMTLLNCTGYNNTGHNYALGEAISFGKVLTITNCLEYGDKRYIAPFAVQTTNSWQGFTVSTDDFNSPGGFDTTGVRYPRNADGSLPIIQFMHLNPNSDLVNNGTDVGLPFSGSAPDIGCFETVELTIVKTANSSRVTGFQLLQNYPNPFNPTTVISYQLPAASFISLKIYDILGREIITLVNEVKAAGIHTVQWNGNNSAGIIVGSGVYFYQLKGSTGLVIAKKMTVLE